uniref:Uncharacterized protein n=1 Tax=Lepeophtheirus salmonis TaxID=72036 RepID=A0A0K2V9Z7_LEPSM
MNCLMYISPMTPNSTHRFSFVVYH